MAREVVSRGCRRWDESLQVLEALGSSRGGEAVAGCTTAGLMSWSVGRTLRSADPLSACMARRIEQVEEWRGFGTPQSISGLGTHLGISPSLGSVPTQEPGEQDGAQSLQQGRRQRAVCQEVTQEPCVLQPACAGTCIAAWLRLSPSATLPAPHACPRVTSEQSGGAGVAKEPRGARDVKLLSCSATRVFSLPWPCLLTQGPSYLPGVNARRRENKPPPAAANTIGCLPGWQWLVAAGVAGCLPAGHQLTQPMSAFDLRRPCSQDGPGTR